MHSGRRLACAGAAVGMLAVALAGCGGGATASVADATDSPTVVTSAGASPSMAPWTPAPQVGPEPAASTAGAMSIDTVPGEVLGLNPIPAQAREGEFIPNGTPVYARDARSAAFEAMPRCGALLPDAWQQPDAALAGSYGAPGGAGVGQYLSLEFATDSAAGEYARDFTEVLRNCSVGSSSPFVARQVAEGPTWDAFVRRYSDGQSWTELVVLHGRFVTLFIAPGDGNPAVAQLDAAATALAR